MNYVLINVLDFCILQWHHSIFFPINYFSLSCPNTFAFYFVTTLVSELYPSDCICRTVAMYNPIKYSTAGLLTELSLLYRRAVTAWHEFNYMVKNCAKCALVFCHNEIHDKYFFIEFSFPCDTNFQMFVESLYSLWHNFIFCVPECDVCSAHFPSFVTCLFLCVTF